MNVIADRNALKTWILNNNPENVLSEGAYVIAVLVDIVLEHNAWNGNGGQQPGPAYGEDWTEWLDALDWKDLVSKAAGGPGTDD